MSPTWLTFPTVVRVVLVTMLSALLSGFGWTPPAAATRVPATAWSSQDVARDRSYDRDAVRVPPHGRLSPARADQPPHPDLPSGLGAQRAIALALSASSLAPIGAPRAAATASLAGGRPRAPPAA